MKAKNDWHLLENGEVLSRLSVDIYKGLDDKEAARRRRKYGSNSVWVIKHESALDVIKQSVFDTATLLLALSAILSAFFDKSYEAWWIIILLAAGGLLRSVTYVRAGRIFEKSALGKIPVCSVIRGGRAELVRANEVTVGDIVFLSRGDTVPGDGRVLSGEATVYERGITENKTAVRKFNSVIRLAKGSRDMPCEYRSNMLFAGSQIISGSVRMAVTAIGENTLTVMKQGGFIIESRGKIPEVDGLKSYSRNTSLIMLICVLILTVLSMFFGDGITLPEVFLSSLAIASAAMSEYLTVGGCVITAVAMRGASDSGAVKKSDKAGAGLRRNNKSSESRANAVIRRPERLYGINNVDRIIFSGASFFKSGNADLSFAVTACGTLTREKIAKCLAETDSPEYAELTALVSYAQTASMDGRMSLSDREEVRLTEASHMSAKAADFIAKKSGKNVTASAALVEHRGKEAAGSMGLESSMVVLDGDYYLISAGKIDDVLTCCTFVKLNEDGGQIQLEPDMRKSILTSCAGVEVRGGKVLAVAMRKSQFHTLDRLPVLTEYMTFVGCFALSEEEEAGVRENVRYLKNCGIKPVLFSNNARNDEYYMTKIGFDGLKKIDVEEIINQPEFDFDGTCGQHGGLIVDFGKAEGGVYSATASAAAKKIGRDSTLAVGRSIWDSSLVSGVKYAASAAESSYKAVPESLSRHSTAVIYPESDENADEAGGLDGVVRVVKASARAENNLRSAKFFVTASQVSRLILMLTSVIFSLPTVTPVFVLLWGLVFDFAAVVVISFEPSFDRRSCLREAEKYLPIASVVWGIIWGGLLALCSFLTAKFCTAEISASVTSASALISSFAVTVCLMKFRLSPPRAYSTPQTWRVKHNKKGRVSFNNAMLAYIILTLAVSLALTLTKTGAEICEGTVCSYFTLVSFLPGIAASVLIFAARLIFKDVKNTGDEMDE